MQKLTPKICDLAGARTQDPHIKSVMLYLLSYQVIGLQCHCRHLRSFASAKVLYFSIPATKMFYFFSVKLTLAMTHYNNLIISAIDNSTLLIVPCPTVNYDVNFVLVTLIYLFRIGQKT